MEAEAQALDMAYDWGVQVSIQKAAAEAWLAHADGATEKALELMKRAAEMEASGGRACGRSARSTG